MGVYVQDDGQTHVVYELFIVYCTSFQTYLECIFYGI